MTCPTCSAQLPDDANFCPSCGRLVRQAPAKASARIPAWVIVLIVVGALSILGIPFLAIVAAILIPNFIHARGVSKMAADQGNLKQIATALEEYAVDHSGRYPDRLVQLQPTYLKSLPEIPGTENAHIYAYHHPSSLPLKAAYDIWDDGSMDPTLFSNVPRFPRGSCAYAPYQDGGASERESGTPCKYVVYVADMGIQGVPANFGGLKEESPSRGRSITK